MLLVLLLLQLLPSFRRRFVDRTESAASADRLRGVILSSIMMNVVVMLLLWVWYGCWLLLLPLYRIVLKLCLSIVVSVYRPLYLDSGLNGLTIIGGKWVSFSGHKRTSENARKMTLSSKKSLIRFLTWSYVQLSGQRSFTNFSFCPLTTFLQWLFPIWKTRFEFLQRSWYFWNANCPKI
jgi:hypothetical protein